MYIVFTSDAYREGTGFHARYISAGTVAPTFVLLPVASNASSAPAYAPLTVAPTMSTQRTAQAYCAGLVKTTVPFGRIASSGNTSSSYLNNSAFSWLIAASSPITLTFESFALESGYDFATVYDGSDRTGRLLARLTGVLLPRPLRSTGRFLFLEFTSDSSTQLAGFVAYYSAGGPGILPPDVITKVPVATAAPCYEWLYAPCKGIRIEKETEGMITDGSGCAPYVANSDCTWMIEGYSDPPTYDLRTQKWVYPPKKPVTLRFEDVDLEYGYDFVKVYDGTNVTSNRLLVVVTGNSSETMKNSYTAPSGMMFVHFTSDNFWSRGGFSARYSNGLATTTVPTLVPSNRTAWRTLVPSLRPTRSPTLLPTVGAKMDMGYWNWTTMQPTVPPPVITGVAVADLVQSGNQDENAGEPIETHGRDASTVGPAVLGALATLAVAAAAVLVVLLRRRLKRMNAVRCSQPRSSEAADVPARNVLLMGDDLPDPSPLPAWTHHDES
jgi:hypothetical protein